MPSESLTSVKLNVGRQQAAIFERLNPLVSETGRATRGRLHSANAPQQRSKLVRHGLTLNTFRWKRQTPLVTWKPAQAPRGKPVVVDIEQRCDWPWLDSRRPRPIAPPQSIAAKRADQKKHGDDDYPRARIDCGESRPLSRPRTIEVTLSESAKLRIHPCRTSITIVGLPGAESCHTVAKK